MSPNGQRPTPSSQALSFVGTFPKRPPICERDLDEMRREAREYWSTIAGVKEPMESVEDLFADGVATRLYRPNGDESAVLVWLHGGGWITGDLDCYASVAHAIARSANCAVLSVEYRLAPEHPYPAAVDDCWSATVWARDEFDQVALGGDSSGGNLAAAVALRASDASVDIAKQLLVYPVLDYASVDGPFYETYVQHYGDFAGIQDFGAVNQAAIRYIWETYVPDPMRRTDPQASPLQAASLAGVAPAFILTAEHDILRGEAEDYAGRLRSEGIDVEIVDYAGQVHGFFNARGIISDARDAVREFSIALRRAVAR